jgi:hypothetical protein
MSLRYRTILATLSKKPIEIIQSKIYNNVLLAGLGSSLISFDSAPTVGNTLLIMVGCDQVRPNNLVGGTQELSNTGSSLPGRVWTITDYSNSYTVQNLSGSPGTFRVMMIEIKNCSNVIGVQSLPVNNNTITSSATNVNKNEMILVFLHKQGSGVVSATNSFNEIKRTTNVSGWERLYTTDEINQQTTLSYIGTTANMRQYTIKLIP